MCILWCENLNCRFEVNAVNSVRLPTRVVQAGNTLADILFRCIAIKNETGTKFTHSIPMSLLHV